MMSRKLPGALGGSTILWLAGCSDSTTSPPHTKIAAATAEIAALAAEVRGLP
jgi:hypothetical protein